MVKVWTIDEVSTKDYDANGNLVNLTDAERNAKLIEWNSSATTRTMYISGDSRVLMYSSNVASAFSG